MLNASEGCAIKIGVSSTALKEARAAIMDILKAGVEEKTKRVALKTLVQACNVNNTTISNCTFTGV